MNTQSSPLLIQSNLVSYQAVCDTELNIIGVEILGESLPLSTDELAIPVIENAILHAFLYASTDALFGQRKVFIKMSETFLMGSALLMLPKDRIVLALLPCPNVSPELIARFFELKNLGYLLALDAWIPNDARKPLLPYVAFIKVSMANTEQAHLAVQQLADNTSRLLATHVNNAQQLALAKSLNVHLLQGQFYRVRNESIRKQQPIMMHALLALIAELNSDGSDNTLDDFFKSNPALSLMLIQLVNSAATAVSITSIRHAILVIGRSKMTHWLNVMLYTLNGDDNSASILMQSAMWRAKFMELMCAQYHQQMSHGLDDMAFITGVISLADVLIGEPLESIIKKMNLSDVIYSALLQRTGSLGTLLSLAESLENGAFEHVRNAAQSLNVSITQVVSCQQEALAWANKIDTQKK